MSDFDNPWKEALDHFFPAFLEFFFPHIPPEVDWARGYESLDKELEQIAHEGDAGTRLADKLFKLWRKDGEETWVLVHVEVQSQADRTFTERMYVYNFRIYDRFRRQVVSLAVLGDPSPNWRPGEFRQSLWGSETLLKFVTAKLLDYGQLGAALEGHANPFALVVLAHLQAQATQRDMATRSAWKVRLIKNLLDRGWGGEDVRRLFKFIDWMMDLPDELSRLARQEIHAYAEEKKVPFITSFERLAREEALKEGRQEGLEEGRQEGLEEGRRRSSLRTIAIVLGTKFKEQGQELLPKIQAVTDPDRLEALTEALLTAASLDDIRPLLTDPTDTQ